MEEFRKKRSNNCLSRGRRIDANVPDVLGNYCLLIEWEFKQLGQSRHGCCKKHRTRIDPENSNSIQCKEVLNPQREENYLSRLLACSLAWRRDRCIERRTATQARWRRRRQNNAQIYLLQSATNLLFTIYYLPPWFFSYLPGYPSIF
jgi:hypothetical protein